MRQKILFLIVVGFFVTMNVLLWRSEYAPNSRLNTSVPTDVVWEKVLTSPDDSWLEIRHRGTKLGRAHWRSRISEQLPPPSDDDPFGEGSLEGMVHQVTGYSLDFSGTVALDELTRLRFDFGLSLDSAQRWQELSIKVVIKPFNLEVNASSKSQTLTITTSEEEGQKKRVYALADLRQPEKLLRDLGGPLLPATLGAMLGPLRLEAGGNGTGGGLTWEARHDKLVFGRTELRVYRLEARLLGRYRAVLVVSPVGEILRVELPDDLVMINDALINY